MAIALLLPVAALAERPTQLIATSYGAAGRVSGSMHVLDTGDARWLVDCGTIYDDELPERSADDERSAASDSQSDTPSRRLPIDAERIAALMLTHTHVDHCGRVPVLVDEGFDGPIYMTRSTATLARVMLEGQVRYDTARMREWVWSENSREDAQINRRRLTVHWRGCKYQNSIGHRNRESKRCSGEELFDYFSGLKPRVEARLCGQCGEDEVARIMQQAEAVEFGRSRRVAWGVRTTFLPAGHIPGAASVLFEVAIDGRVYRVLYSGDLGNELSPLMPGPPPAPKVDAVFVEGTYGATHRRSDVAKQRAEFRKLLGRIVEEKGVVWIPAFALDRTQKVLYEIRLAQDEGLLPERLPVYVPSPSARRFTEIYEQRQEKGWFPPAVAEDDDAFAPSEIERTVPWAAKLPRPCIIISISDVMYTEWMRRLLRSLLPEPSTHLVLVGYTDPASATGQLKQGIEQIHIDGRRVDVEAEVHSFGCFSGHGDATDIDRWLKNVPNNAPVVLVHGDESALRERAEQLRRQGRQHVLVAEEGSPIDLLELIQP